MPDAKRKCADQAGLAEREALRARLQEAEETLAAIRAGDVDALIVGGPAGERVFVLEGADHSYRAMVEQMSDAAVALSAEGVILFANPALAGLLGFGQEQLVGRRLREYVVQPNREPVEALLLQGVCVSAKCEVLLLAAGGEEIPAKLSISPMRLKGMDCLSAIITDIRPQRRAEELQATLDERRLYEERLQAALQQVEAANKAKSAFLANMSHEIRTPLNGIMGMLQLLQQSPMGEEQALYAEHALKASNRLLRLLSDILDISRVEAGKLRIEAAPFRLEEVLQALEQLFLPAAESRGLALRFKTQGEIPSLLTGDGARLHQILANLIGNALKFTDAGAVEVTVAALSVLRPGACRLLFSVADTGCGIPEQELERMFEPFVQSDSGHARRHQGAGLGLSITRHLVKLMGGDMSVESSVQQGTTFHFTLSLPVPAQEAAPPAQETVDKREMEPLRILLVEDDAINRLAMEVMLRRMGHAVTLARDGEEALGALKELDFDCVLMDVQMPVLDGVEATRIIRTAPEFARKSGLPVIALTAYAMQGDRERLLQAGMNDYVAKPVQMAALEKALGAVCRQGKARSGTARSRRPSGLGPPEPA